MHRLYLNSSWHCYFHSFANSMQNLRYNYCYSNNSPKILYSAKHPKNSINLRPSVVSRLNYRPAMHSTSIEVRHLLLSIRLPLEYAIPILTRHYKGHWLLPMRYSQKCWKSSLSMHCLECKNYQPAYSLASD